MADLVANPNETARATVAKPKANLDTVYARLNIQRKAALKSFWLTALRCLLLLPVAFAPMASFVFLVFDHLPGSAAAEIARQGRDLIEPINSAFAIGGVVWLLGGLYLLGRYFVRRGRQPCWDYVREYKQSVFNALCDQHFPGLTYDPTKAVGYNEFDATRLFEYTSAEYRSEDYFSGRMGKTDIHFAEVVAKRERKYWSKGRRQTTYETFFQGLVFVAEFHKHFHSTTRIIPRSAKPPKVSGQRSVALEDPDFEELFSTLSTDQVDVRYILSTSMVRRFVKLHRRFFGMRVLFDRDKVLLALPSMRDQFEPSLYRDAGASAQVDRFIADIRSLLQVVEELDLNTRIWSKK